MLHRQFQELSRDGWHGSNRQGTDTVMLSLYPFTLYSWLLLIASGVSLWLAYLGARQRQLPVAYWFSWLCLTEAVYTFGYAFELASRSLEQAKFWINIEMLGGAYIPALIVLMALSYRQHRHPPIGITAALLILASLTLAVILGNDQHHLMFSDMQIIRRDNLTITLLEFGPWYYLHLVYINVGVTIGNILFYHCWRRAPRYHRRQVMLILLGTLIPWGCYLLFLLDWAPNGVDLSAFGFIITGPLCAYSLFRYRFADLSPIAREQVFDEMEEAVLVVDHNYRMVDFNRKACALLPALNQQSLGQDCRPLLGDIQPPLEPSQQESEHVMNQGGRHYELRCQPLRQKTSELMGYSLMLRDTTERQLLLEQLRQYAEVDELTGVMNRRMALQTLEQEVATAWQSQQPLSLVLFDVDRFKRINDSQGHQIGDLILRQLASLLQTALNSGEALGRYGGDEFLLVLPGRDLASTQALAEQLNQLARQQLNITLSLGLTHFEPHDTARVMLRRADLALYRAKSQGRSQACIADPLPETSDLESNPMR